MDKFAGDMYLELTQADTTVDELNLNAIWVDLDKGKFLKTTNFICLTKVYHINKNIIYFRAFI
jgi:hypothetical protein